MPRLKNAPRQRSLRACLQCRKRKEKCDGRQPCQGCDKRRIDCSFDQTSPINRNVPRQSEGSPISGNSQPGSPIDSAPPSVPSHRYSSRASSRKTQQNQNQAIPEQSEAGADDSSEAPVPRSARLLSDGHGQFIYIGDSASVSFVQNVRIVVLSKIGSCGFTNDDHRHSFYEQNGVSDRQVFEQFSQGDGFYSKPPAYEADMLLDKYLLATSAILDLFDRHLLRQDLRAWAISNEYPSDFTSASFYLILAIGAQVIDESGYEAYADRYFFIARRTLLGLGTEQPCLEAIRCYILIAVYLLCACRRNASYMNLGTAVRAAYALGLHRADLVRLFREDERRSRERTWQSLRIMDIFLSASLGRPPSTSESVGDQSLQNGLDTSSLGTREERSFFALLHLCSIFESILFEVYQKQEVSTKLADEIAKKYRDWSSKLPLLLPSLDEENAELAQVLESAHVLGTYHWSIILLTRPFLMFRLSSAANKHSTEEDPVTRSDSKINSISVCANACVDSAVRCLDIAEDLIQFQTLRRLPRRLPFILNSVFNSALAIGAAFFGDYDRRFPIKDSMEKAQRVLNDMRLNDPQARRYSEIVTHLDHAAKSYVRKRDSLYMERQSKAKDSIFGNVRSIKPHRGEAPVNQSSPESLNLNQGPSSDLLSDHLSEPQMISTTTPRGQDIVSQQSATLNPCLATDVFLGHPSSDAERANVANQATEENTTAHVTSDDLLSSLFAYPYTIPTFTSYGDLDSSSSEQPDWRNFVMTMTP